MLANRIMMTKSTGTATVSYISTSTNTVDQTTYTFTNQNIGGPGLIVVAAHGDGGSGGDISSCTIGGSAATPVILSNQAALSVGLFSKRITSGTTATIVVTYGASVGRCGIYVFRIQGVFSDAVRDTASNNGVAASLSVTVDALEDGVIVAAATNDVDRRMTWSGVTESYDVGIEANVGTTGGVAETTSDDLGRTITVTDGTSTQLALVAAVWR